MSQVLAHLPFGGQLGWIGDRHRHNNNGQRTRGAAELNGLASRAFGIKRHQRDDHLAGRRRKNRHLERVHSLDVRALYRSIALLGTTTICGETILLSLTTITVKKSRLAQSRLVFIRISSQQKYRAAASFQVGVTVLLKGKSLVTMIEEHG